MTTTVTAITITLQAITALLLIDASAFALWILSGQLPAQEDPFFLGSLTAHALAFIIL
jgi:hypothetical protein